VDDHDKRACACSLVRAPPCRLLPAANATQAEPEALPPSSSLRTAGTRISSNADRRAGVAVLLFQHISAKYPTVRFHTYPQYAGSCSLAASVDVAFSRAQTRRRLASRLRLSTVGVFLFSARCIRALTPAQRLRLGRPHP
jgi:hypothetical protein